MGGDVVDAGAVAEENPGAGALVAELGPPQPGRATEVSDALLADVVRRGWLKPPIAISEVLPVRKPVAPLADLLEDLDRDRSDR